MQVLTHTASHTVISDTLGFRQSTEVEATQMDYTTAAILSRIESLGYVVKTSASTARRPTPMRGTAAGSPVAMMATGRGIPLRMVGRPCYKLLSLEIRKTVAGNIFVKMAQWIRVTLRENKPMADR